MTINTQFQILSRDPLLALRDAPDEAVLAIIAGVEGPSYRPVGAMMTVLSEMDRAGTLSSGCIEADISIHAMRTLDSGKPEMIRYGRGSPFMDIQLPCGGGLDILLLPRPDQAVLDEVLARREARRACTLEINCESGAMQVVETGETGREGAIFRVRFEPALRFLVFGKGPEASTFSALVQSAGYPNLLLSPDSETLDIGRHAGCETHHLVRQAFPDDLGVDAQTAIVLFFHDHDWEPPLLAGALETPAFYIGAQGSQRARDARNYALMGMGVSDAAIDRLHGPVGLIPSARDAGTLAVSVLAEILATAKAQAD